MPLMGGAPPDVAEPLVLMVAPLAAHLAEELWAKLGHDQSLAFEPFPVADPTMLVADTIRYTDTSTTLPPPPDIPPGE